jgi:proteasome accessory factor A
VSDRLFGVETEYAVAGFDPRGRPLDRHAVVGAMLSEARRALPHIPDVSGGGVFLANGARFYLDCGLHPEMTTPECSTPWEVVRYILAGEHILRTLVARRRCFGRRSKVALYRCNVDYSGSHATWGCHESYMHRVSLRTLPAQIIPHLVSRLIYSGAGGFNSVSAGIEFTLSPRVPHMITAVSSSSTHGRGIFHTKDEPLSSAGTHRLHLLCGESLCSQTAMLLKVGTTALVVALIEAGAEPGTAVALKDPLSAMNVFASDPTCTLAVETADGRHLRAIDVQRHYLELVERHLNHPCMPPWADACCLLWRSILDRVEGGAAAVANVLDWAIKLPIYQEHAQRRGWTWESLALWNQAIAHVAVVQSSTGGGEIDAEILSAAEGPLCNEMRRLEPFLESHGMSWSLLPAFLDLRRELFEIDFRFGQIGDQGIFTRLDGAGVLAHRVAGVEDIERATKYPPALGRARVRGAYVRQLGRKSTSGLVCDWSGIWDHGNNRTVDLRDPFVSDASWGEWVGRRPLDLASLMRDPPDSDPEQVAELEQRGDYAAAEPLRRQSILDAERRWGPDHPETALLCNQLGVILRNLGRPREAEPWCRRALQIDQAVRGNDDPKIPHRLNNLALVLVMQDKLSEARQRLARAWSLKAGQHDITSARVLWTRVTTALVGSEASGTFLGLMRSLFSLPSLPATGGVIRYWQVVPVVDFVRPRISPADADLLVQLAEVLNYRRRLPRLDAFASWADQAPLPLETAWPQEERDAVTVDATGR